MDRILRALILQKDPAQQSLVTLSLHVTNFYFLKPFCVPIVNPHPGMRACGVQKSASVFAVRLARTEKCCLCTFQCSSESQPLKGVKNRGYTLAFRKAAQRAVRGAPGLGVHFCEHPPSCSDLLEVPPVSVETSKRPCPARVTSPLRAGPRPDPGSPAGPGPHCAAARGTGRVSVCSCCSCREAPGGGYFYPLGRVGEERERD